MMFQFEIRLRERVTVTFGCGVAKPHEWDEYDVDWPNSSDIRLELCDRCGERRWQRVERDGGGR